jgi:hypothetical protein
MDSAWAKATLRYLKPAPFAKQNIFCRYTDIVKMNLSVSQGGIIVA